MYGKLRRLKIQEPQSEDFALRTGALGSDKRVENDTNLKPAPGWNLPARPGLEFEHTEAVNDLAWLTAEDRLKRPDPVNQVSIGDGTHTVSFS